MNIGINDQHCKQLANELIKLLANTYALYIKTQNFHWNVVGMEFYSLHKMFEEQYEALAEAIDEIAERIRALGQYTPASFADFSRLATIKDASDRIDAKKMLDILLKDHETILREARTIFPLADEAGDEGTADLVTDRLREHEKFAWMLRSQLT